jgi:hypothetical protein
VANLNNIHPSFLSLNFLTSRLTRWGFLFEGILKMSKQLTRIEASFTAALMAKIDASAYEFGSKIDYLSIDYNKATDDVLIGLKKDKEPDLSRISLKEAQFISWLIPYIVSMQNRSGISIQSIQAIYDGEGLKLDIMVNDDAKQ